MQKQLFVYPEVNNVNYTGYNSTCKSFRLKTHVCLSLTSLLKTSVSVTTMNPGAYTATQRPLTGYYK